MREWRNQTKNPPRDLQASHKMMLLLLIIEGNSITTILLLIDKDLTNGTGKSRISFCKLKALNLYTTWNQKKFFLTEWKRFLYSVSQFLLRPFHQKNNMTWFGPPEHQFFRPPLIPHPPQGVRPCFPNQNIRGFHFGHYPPPLPSYRFGEPNHNPHAPPGGSTRPPGPHRKPRHRHWKNPKDRSPRWNQGDFTCSTQTSGLLFLNTSCLSDGLTILFVEELYF